MAKIFEWDCRKGTLLSSANELCTLSGTNGLVKSKHGICVSTKKTGSEVHFLNPKLVSFDYSKPFSISAVFFVHSVNANSYLFSLKRNGEIAVMFTLYSDTFIMSQNLGNGSGGIRRDWVNKTRVFNCLTFNYDGSKKSNGLKVYLNGEQKAFTSNIDVLVINSDLVLGKFNIILTNASGTDPRKRDIYYVVMNDKLTSLKEHQKLYKDFLNSKPQSHNITY